MRNTLTCSLNRVSVLVLVALLGLSCGQYDYTSPPPGILEIRLKTKNSRPELLPFGESSSFVFNMKDLEVFTSSGNRLPVLPEINAIRRRDAGEFFNALDTLARDSSRIMGRTYAPPGEYSRLEIFASIQAGSAVVVPNFGGVIRIIIVEQPLPLPPSLKKLPRQPGSLSFTVNEGRTTIVNVTLDLDSTLTRRAETFLGQLEFHISSVQNR